MTTNTTITEDHVRGLLEEVKDPEIPVINIRELGVLRGVEVEGDHVKVTITPTYSGCPAMTAMEEDIKKTLRENGIEHATVETKLSPAWTTDDITEAGRRKLKEYGIAPPEEETEDKSELIPGMAPAIQCPQCGSRETELISQFGSTACKALYRCTDCKETFDYFKCLK